MWIICKVKGVSLKCSGKEILAMGLLSIFYAATSFFLTASYKYISSGTATTIHFFYPVVVALAMILLFGEKVSIWKIIAIVSGIAGVFFLSGGITGEKISLTGLILVLVTVITYPTYVVGVNQTPVVMRMNGMKQTFLVLFFSAIIFFVNVLVKGAHFSPLSTSYQWEYAIALAIIPTLVSDFALIYAIQMAGSTITAILGCMEPLVAVICGVIFFGETFTANSLAGILLVFAAVFIIILCSRPRKQ
jgi:drug/metabolite transporter (DMT)-like permease